MAPHGVHSARPVIFFRIGADITAVERPQPAVCGWYCYVDLVRQLFMYYNLQVCFLCGKCIHVYTCTDSIYTCIHGVLTCMSSSVESDVGISTFMASKSHESCTISSFKINRSPLVRVWYTLLQYST